MLNVSLIEQFQTIHQQQLGGAVEVTLGERKVRFGFEGGELCLLDMGEEKELAMARKFLDYHKIGPEIHRHAVAMARATGGSIVDTLRRQQLVSDSEINQIGQAMIEDLFSLVFGISAVQMDYRPQEPLDSFDLDKRAVRLKIAIPSLLESVKARVADEEEVMGELGGWGSPLGLDEGGDTDQLDDFENHILTQVDGKKTVEQIAIAFRDSNFNIGRMLVGMIRKGFVKRLGSSATRQGKPSSVAVLVGANAPEPTTEGGDGDAPAPATGASGFEVYHPTEAPPPSSGFRMMLATVLAVLVAIGMFAWFFSGDQGAVGNRLTKIEQQIAQSEWIGAREDLEKARGETANDFSATREVDRLEKLLEEELGKEAKRVDQLIEDQQFASANEALERLPADHPRGDELRQRRNAQLKEFEEHSTLLIDQVRDCLDRYDAAGAFALIGKVRPAEAEAPLKSIERWRLTTLEKAKRTSLSMGERQSLVNLLLAARPTAYQKEQLQLLQEELNRGQNRRREQVRSLAKQVDRGSWLVAQTEIDKEHLLDQAPGSALLAEVNAMTERIKTVRKDLESVPQACSEALTAASDPQAVVRARQRLAEILTQYPDASNLAELKSLDLVLSTLEPVVGHGSTADEATALGSLLIDQPPESALVKAAKARIAALHVAAIDAEAAMETARAFGRDGQWDECIAALTRIGSRSEWRRTPAGLAVSDEITQAQASKQRLADVTKKFNDRLAAGDIAGAYDLSRQMGLRYLPLLIESVPSGAAVMRGTTEIGKTPMVMEISAGERVDLQLELRAQGCEPLILSGAAAIGGWRLTGALRRKPVATAQLKTTVSALPAGGEGSLWVAGAAGVASVNLKGIVKTYPYADAATGSAAPIEPVYAPATALEDGIYVATRDRFALRIHGEKISRVPLAAATDLALLSYRSTVILDRRFLICAGLDGIVVASDPGVSGSGWKSRAGSQFAGPLGLVGDAVLAVRRDGEVLSLQVDRGDQLSQQSIGDTVVAAWATPTGLAGITSALAWTWNGSELTKTPLPRGNVVAAAPGVLVTRERQVLVFDGTDWKQAGQCPGDLTATPTMWKGRPVLVSGKTVYVLGLGGFQVDSTSSFLAPAVVGDHLALVTSTGDISFFAP